MNEEEYLKRFEDKVLWLQNAVPPDDIYYFAQQAIIAAEFFIQELDKVIDLKEKMIQDSIFDTWVKNILSLRACEQDGVNYQIDTEFKDMKDKCD